MGVYVAIGVIEWQGTYQTKKITYILARPQNEKVEKAASRRSKNIDNEAKSRQIRPLTSS